MQKRIQTKDEQGQTMVEFALVLPILCLIVFGIIQFGIAFNNYLTLTDGVRAGARKAAVSRHEANPVETTKAAVRAASTDLNGDLQIEVTSNWRHGQDVVVKATYPYEIKILGKVFKSGRLESQTTERVE